MTPVPKEENTSQNWGSVDEATSTTYAGGISTIDITKENKWFYLLVVIFLGLTTISAVIGTIILACYGKAIPNALVAIGSVAVGALGTIFSKNT